jgi:hypothetical protein
MKLEKDQEKLHNPAFLAKHKTSEMVTGCENCEYHVYTPEDDEDN